MLLDAHRRLLERVPEAGLIVAPRHPERAAEVVELARRRGFEVVCRSELPQARSAGALIVVDTVGELASMYSAGCWPHAYQLPFISCAKRTRIGTPRSA